ncbi:hypothetical protein ACFY7Y_29010 [Streptomyces virginiae]|uniref:hypothetical protein n=1 Tax=Streptomyces virginiae TaxID=1961 RepID=UPI0036C06E53
MYEEAPSDLWPSRAVRRASGLVEAYVEGYGDARAGLPFAEVACVAGYADQAHLSREVRAPAGTTPRAYAAGADGANSETPPPSGSSTTA